MKFGTVYNHSDTLRYFGFRNRHYNYMNYKDKQFSTKWYQSSNQISGWVEIKDKGAINLCKGIAVVYGYGGPAFSGAGAGASPGMYGGGGTSMTLIPMY